MERCLGGRVDWHLGERKEGEARGDVDDGWVLLLQEVGHEEHAQVDGRVDVDLQLLAQLGPLLLGWHLLEIHKALDACIVDQDIHLKEEYEMNMRGVSESLLNKDQILSIKGNGTLLGGKKLCTIPLGRAPAPT